MSYELMLCQQTLLDEIGNKSMHRRDVAQTYALAMRSGEQVDWAVVNKAIIERWSPSALRWIKEQAWSGKCFADKV